MMEPICSSTLCVVWWDFFCRLRRPSSGFSPPSPSSSVEVSLDRFLQLPKGIIECRDHCRREVYLKRSLFLLLLDFSPLDCLLSQFLLRLTLKIKKIIRPIYPITFKVNPISLLKCAELLIYLFPYGFLSLNNQI